MFFLFIGIFYGDARADLRENFKEQATCPKGENAYSYCKLSDVTNS